MGGALLVGGLRPGHPGPGHVLVHFTNTECAMLLLYHCYDLHADLDIALTPCSGTRGSAATTAVKCDVIPHEECRRGAHLTV